MGAMTKASWSAGEEHIVTTQTPATWRLLGEVGGHEVYAVPDDDPDIPGDVGEAIGELDDLDDDEISEAVAEANANIPDGTYELGAQLARAPATQFCFPERLVKHIEAQGFDPLDVVRMMIATGAN